MANATFAATSPPPPLVATTKHPSMAKEVMNWRWRADVEYQDWGLLFMTMTCVWLLCMPCFCGGLPYPSARKFAVFLQARLPTFYFVMVIFLCGTMGLVLDWLPDWTVGQYLAVIAKTLGWLAKHMIKFTVSFVIIMFFCFLAAFKNRIALMAGVDHVHMLRFSWRDCLSCWSMKRFRPCEIAIWKVEDMPSKDLFRANNIFVEANMGFNEVMKSRVHHNAGSACVLKERLQFNFDENDSERMLLFVKTQEVMGTSELGRLQLEAQHILENIDRGGGGRGRRGPEDDGFWNNDVFEERRLIPRGKIWFKISYIQEERPQGMEMC